MTRSTAVQNASSPAAMSELKRNKAAAVRNRATARRQ
jgi:hypothetical protein